MSNPNEAPMPAKAPAFQTLRYHAAQGVARIELNRPQRRNAIDLVMRHELLQAIAVAAEDADVKALILTGAGGHFCSGGDVSTMCGAHMSAEQGRARMEPVTACARALMELPKPVIAAVDGVAYGAGFSMCLCADLVIATPDARLCLSFMRIGLVPDFACAFTLPRIVGWQRAKQLIYCAAEIDGATAHDWGIVAELSDPQLLDARAMQIAMAMGSMPPTAFAMTKQALLRSFTADLAASCEAEANAQGVAFNTQYHQRAAELLLARAPLPYTFPPAQV